SKGRLLEENEAQDRLVCQRNLVFILDTIVRLMHPVMPYVTEEIYATLPGNKDSEYLIGAAWPDKQDYVAYIDTDAQHAIDMVCDAVSAIRSVRSRYGISPKTGMQVIINIASQDIDLLCAQSALIESMANTSSLSVSVDAAKPAESAVVLAGGMEIYVVLSGLVDFEAEKQRLNKEKAVLEVDAKRLEGKLSNEGYLSKAAPEIIAKDRAKLEEINDKLSRINGQLTELC
ncbi:MAG: class I tRNA ligase family protein, partial [Eggerthellaceae bacterium]|nr:class I tRNA ligase family protein [Eggerthellaceae bacterium]